jgi:hypothetical protein
MGGERCGSASAALMPKSRSDWRLDAKSALTASLRSAGGPGRPSVGFLVRHCRLRGEAFSAVRMPSPVGYLKVEQNARFKAPFLHSTSLWPEANQLQPALWRQVLRNVSSAWRSRSQYRRSISLHGRNSLTPDLTWHPYQPNGEVRQGSRKLAWSPRSGKAQ